MSCPTCEPQPSLAALQRAYEAACVAYCECCSDASQTYWQGRVRETRAALNAATVQQGIRSDEEAAIKAITGLHPVPSEHSALGWRQDFQGIDRYAAASILSHLRAAGFSVSRTAP